MKLFYITRVDISSSAAQGVQIDAMCQEFDNQINEFKLISAYPQDKKIVNYKWDKILLGIKFRYLQFIIKSSFKIIKEKPTHIFTRDIVVAFVFSFFNKKVIYEAHKEPRTKTANFMINYLKSKSNFLLVTISTALKNHYINKYSFEANKILDIHDGVFLKPYHEIKDIKKDDIRKELNLPLDKLLVVHTGSLHKGDDAKLFKSIIDNFHDMLFVQVGGKENDIKEYKEFYKNNKNILFIPHQNHKNIIKYQMSADILFYALDDKNKLWWCTSPLKIFEYMATNIPIIASNIGSVAEIINQNNAIIYNPKDEKSIINAIEYFLNNKEKSIQKSYNSLKDIKEKYTWEKRVNKILEFIK
jgi:glycosyltransferase involved in cell wall biosynthesis